MNLSRRKFILRSCQATAGSYGVHMLSGCRKPLPKIENIKNHDIILKEVPSDPKDEEWVYQLAVPFQISSTEMALAINIRRGSVKTIDVEVGSDLIVFDQLPPTNPRLRIPLNRRTFEKHPKTGEDLYVSRYPVIGGFVPLEAKLPSGEDHPHAGTGFGISFIRGFPADMSARIATDLTDPYEAFEVHQYRYDGKTFHIDSSAITDPKDIFPDWEYRGNGLSYAIPDGEDLLWANSAKNDKHAQGTGLSRWRRIDGKWQAIDYISVTGEDLSFEPTVVRDLDGSLLFTARGCGAVQAAKKLPNALELRKKDEEAIRLWRSVDNGKSWEKILHVQGIRAGTPVTIATTSDGSPYIVGNPQRDLDSRGRKQSSIEMRETLMLWPLGADRRSLGEPLMVRDTRADFGPAPRESIWRADHPIGRTVRLADGKWRHLLFYRVLTRQECVGDAPITPSTGAYMAEVVSKGPVQMPWRF